MILTEMQLASAISSSKLGRYDMIKLTLEWISLNRQSEDFRGLTQVEVMNKGLSDVVSGIVTPEKISELRSKRKKTMVKIHVAGDDR